MRANDQPPRDEIAGAPSVERLCRILADPDRRDVVRAIVGRCGGPVDTTETCEAVTLDLDELCRLLEGDGRSQRLQAVHRDLPLLADAALLDYDHSASRVRVSQRHVCRLHRSLETALVELEGIERLSADVVADYATTAGEDRIPPCPTTEDDTPGE